MVHSRDLAIEREVEIRDVPSLVKAGQNVAALEDASTLLAQLSPLGESIRLALIDPPYNRRTKFHHYSDSISSESWRAEREEHCAHLRALLLDNGSLWMHIDDAEMPAARLLLDRVFGAKNFIATIVWQKSVSRDNRTAVSTTHEYLLAYAKNRSTWSKHRNKIPPGEEQLGRYRNPDDDPRGPWTSGDLTAKAGPGRRDAQFYDLVTPAGRIVRPSAGTAWRFTWERMQEMIADNRIYFGDGDRMPRLKRFLSEVEAGLVPNTWWPGDEVGTADTAKRHLKSMFPDSVPFETPKPEGLAARVLTIATDPGDLVIDVYGGSGTTAAVSHKMLRRWVTSEREPSTFENVLLPRLSLVSAGRDPGGVTQEVGWLGGGTYVWSRGSTRQASDEPRVPSFPLNHA
jgi:adenine-specific DNA-methyltransferase